MRFIPFLAVLTMGCSTDTFVGTDGSPGADAGTGDAIAADVATIDVAACAPTWCSTQPQMANQLCTDFDKSSTLPLDWGLETSGGPVSLSISPADQCQSLHSHMPIITATGGSAARLIHATNVQFPTGVHAVLTLDVFLPVNDPGGPMYYFALRGGGVSVGLFERPDGTFWLQSTQTQNTLAVPLASQGPVRGKFTPMTLDVTYEPNQLSAALTYRRGDDNSEQQINGNGNVVQLSGTVTFAVGMYATSTTTTAVDAYYDDILAFAQ